TKLYTNLGNRDTHAVINNMRWGLDGWVYATHGYSSTEDAQSGDGSKGFGPIGAGVVRFKPDGSAIEQYASRGGNTWGLDITSDGQVFYTQPTSGNHFIHVVLPEYVLAKGKLPGVMGTNGMLPKEPTYPAMHWEQQAYVQIDQVGSFTAGAGCAIYEGGAWPKKWNYGYFVTEPTLNIVSHFMVEPNGVTFKAHREPGREQTEFIRSTNLWFRPIEVRVGPDGALYVVDFCNQAVIHNDTRGPTHGPANAAVRPDRDHYYGRIWKVQHKEAKQVSARNTAASKGTQGSAALKSYEVAKEAVKSDAGRQQALKDFAAAQDDWTRSALIAACSEQALPCIEAALTSGTGEALVAALLPAAIPSGADKLVVACAAAGAKSDAIKAAVLRGIVQQGAQAPALTPELIAALKKLLGQPALAAVTLPLVTKWDKGGALKAEVKAELAKLMKLFRDDVKAAEDLRLAAAMGLVGARGADGTILGEVFETLGSDSLSAGLKLRLVQSLGEQADAEVGKNLAFAFARLPKEVQPAAFEAILKRPEATSALLDAVNAGTIDRALFAPGDVARLRSHPNKPIAKRANDLFKINNAAKDAILAKLIPEVEKPGNAANGKMMFTAACAVCHKLGDIGAPVGPPLDGMGAHGPAELLVHIVDPNREVDPSFWAFNITTKKGEAMQGVVTSENTASVTLATQQGVKEIAKSDIDKRENTRRSLMPDGLDALGPEVLRDILAFICGDAARQFRILHLSDAFTADSREGVFAGPAANQGQVRLAKYGNVTASKVPFFIQDATKSANGANLIVLKGGPAKSQSATYPAKVEIPVGVETKRIQMLSGIAGWGFPAVREENTAIKATVLYASGEKEEFDLKNGVHFSDYVRNVEVPGSNYVEGITDGQQMRLLTLELTKKGVAKTLVLESPENNHVAPVVLAITADIEGKGPAAGSTDVAKRPEPAPRKGKDKADDSANANMKPEDSPKEGGKGDGPLAPAIPVAWEAGKTKVLVIGGGSSHNFAKFMGGTDVDTLKAAGFSVHYTEDRDQAAAELKNADVAVISVNRKFFDTAAYRAALMDFAAAGKGIVMLHPGTWYGFSGWPELNAQIVGGGSRGHDKIHPFDVKTLRADHPIMAGVPASFTVEDELYYMNAEPDKTPPGTAKITVLAETSPSDKFQVGHPSVWTTEHPKAKIAGIALGHDERTHDHAAFKTILSNAVKWASGK
ncbi:MAG TPA: PVC-type heme-binding CxxCH protein, partial [Prosthecobacter sp.]